MMRSKFIPALKAFLCKNAFKADKDFDLLVELSRMRVPGNRYEFVLKAFRMTNSINFMKIYEIL